MVNESIIKPAVFLSAGVPDQPDRGPYIDTADPVAIRDAVRALTGVVLETPSVLVFGGHPAITPLVAQVAESIEKLGSVIIYQSEWFRDLTPKEVNWFENLRWTERKETRDQSLYEMRRRMFSDDDLSYKAAVYVGGMDGVEIEQAMFQEWHFEAQQYPIGSTGGAALNLWKKRHEANFPFRDQLLKEKDMQYQSLFEEIFG